VKVTRRELIDEHREEGHGSPSKMMTLKQDVAVSTPLSIVLDKMDVHTSLEVS
jgi:hypothetical protein